MLSREAIESEIDRVLAKSDALYRAALAKHKRSVESAFSGAGFQSETATKRAMAETILPANQGFRKGGLTDYLGNAPSPDDAVAHFEVPDGMQGGYAGAPASESAFADALKGQYPTIVEMSQIARPKAETLEEHYSRPTTPKYESTTPGETVFQSLGFPAVPTKAAGMSTLEKLLAIFDDYALGRPASFTKQRLGL